MSDVLPEIRRAVRSLLQQPGFTLAAVVTLALAIGANTAIFSLVDAVLLTPPPFRDPGRLAVIWQRNPEVAKVLGYDDLLSTPATFFDWQRDSRSFERLAEIQTSRMILTGQGEPEPLETLLVTGDFFPLLGTSALIGRTLVPAYDAPGAPPAIVLSYNFWRRRFAGDRGVVGRTFLFNGQPRTVVGVMPPRFDFPRGSEVSSLLSFTARPDAWMPRSHKPADQADRGNRASLLIGRLRLGLGMQAAEDELNRLAERYAEIYPNTDKGWSVRLVPIAEQRVQGIRPALLVLWAAVALVLLIACVNVANLLFARAASRQREIAVRMALGAGRFRLIAQALSESTLLALAGGLLGGFLAWASLRLFAASAPPGLAGVASFALNGRALLFTLGLCVLTGLLAGLVPALQMTRPDLASTLREGTRAGAGTTRNRLTRSALVVAEVAIAVVVLVGAGLLLRSFLRLLDVDPGFRGEHVLSFRLDLPADRPPEEMISFYNRLEQQIDGLPGTTAASLVSELPTSGQDNVTAVMIEGKDQPRSIVLQQLASLRMVTPGYLDTLKIPLRKGRFLRAGDTRNATQVAVIDEAMAASYWPGEDPLGKRFLRMDRRQPPWVTVVGVVGNVRHADLFTEPRPTVYMTPDQVLGYYVTNQMAAVIRTPGDPRALTSAVRQAVAAVDRTQPVTRILPMTEVVAESMAKSRFSLLLLSVLAVLSLVLAVVGIYGITAYSIAQRTREIGLRMALGARPGEVLRLVVGETARLAALGIVLGLALAWVLARTAAAASYLSSLLFEVTATDPATFAGVAAALLLAALAAAWLPGRRATRVSPMEALRSE
ncbi:MAG TPA: ABC transporter permease [Thermoanaerobaculia bacterium]|nr:ABC transporter permease [Thermoanaerobaculia bacterium]